MFSIHGTGIGGGIAIGRARVLESRQRDVPRYRLRGNQLDAELSRLETAIEVVRAELCALGEHLSADAPAEARALLDVHLMILDDPLLAQAARDSMREHMWNAEWAFSAQAGHLAAQFEEIEDEYLRERGRDVQHVAERVIRVLSGSTAETTSDAEPVIFVAADISPADMLSLRAAIGFGIDLGGATSHTAILARSMNVPAVVGLGCASQLIVDDDWLILDGEAGLLIVAPDETVLAEYRRRQAAALLARERLKWLIHLPSVTADGVEVQLQANIERPGEAVRALAAGASGVGLFRSEFLFMNRRDLPDEDEQFEAYREAVTAMQGRPVTIRTLDLGADKSVPALRGAAPQNPALGQRAIRYCLAETGVFLVQLRAILRASAFGSVRLLLPMLAHSHEIDQALRLVELAREQLRQRGEAFDPATPIGGMVEVPAAALTAGLFVRKLDFLSIGTNDLIQYTLAIDRSDHDVASLYEPFHPAVLRLIGMTIRTARKAGKPVAVCGEMAGDWAATHLLLGMGLTEFSMHPASLLRVKQEILRADTSRLAPRVSRLLAADDPLRVRALLARLVEDH
ncbi:MAG: phosphoenolpyruvate--protein phosphotransferase [Lautropia sp.]|nr:MAG: phosphoenolpyruvate--protein phosphotransferase [Pseudomonadota bacterium]MBC6960674.1 phosphoenolpyruvate--protein phosphotransferase [Lautropia sp.]MDL1908872.1 phosphoenolpyruvate--protein phosphotransferase [Betaproteobacteria bacterium PRO1]RIK87506.1 MAG: phosphoenolpyruvate--protein phosphotransferase [Burkholderiales bacterium]